MILLFLSIIILLFIMRKPRCALREAYNPNRSLGRVRIFYITSCGLSAFIRCLSLVFNS